MAARVNTRFVVILSAVLLAAVGAVAALGYQAIKKSGEDYIKLGDTAMAENKPTEAVGFYAKAVFKDQKNAAWIRKWIGAMEQTTPEGRTAYQEQYHRQYLNALKALSDADHSDLPAHKAYLQEVYGELRFTTPRLADFEGMVRIAEDMIRTYQGDAAAGKVLLRYRALPTVSMLSINPDMKAAQLDAARKDLEAVVALDPTDTESVIALARIDLILAERAKRDDDLEEHKRLQAQSRARLADFVSRHPPASGARLALLNLDAAIAASSASGAEVSVQEFLQDRRAQLQELIDAIKAEKPENADIATVSSVVSYAQIALPQEGAKQEIDAIFAQLSKARADDAAFLLMWARIEMMRGQPDAALALLTQVVELPEKKLSAEGARLFGQRLQAIALQADVIFSKWEREPDPAKKVALAAQAQGYRDALVAKVGETENLVLALDARLELIKGNTRGARTLLTRYNDQTGERDLPSMALLAELLLREGNIGAARTTFERVLARDGRNQRALRALGQYELETQNYAEALKYVNQLAALNPEDKALQEQKGTLEDIVKGQVEPYIACLLKAQAFAGGVAPDFNKAIETIEACIKEGTHDIRLYMTIAQLRMRLEQREQAIDALDRAIAKYPEQQANLQKARDSLAKADPIASNVENIDKMNLSPLQKALAKYDAFSRAGKPDEARPFLDEMIALSPDDPEVIERRFQDAVARKDSAKIAELVALAEARNSDKVNGLLYKARQQIIDGKFDESAQSLRTVLERDKLNQLAWRLLGFVELQRGKAPEAVEALAKAVEMRPNDLAAINGYLRAQLAVGNCNDALNQARRSESLAGGDGEFAELLLYIETNCPGGDKDKARELRERIATLDSGNRLNKAELAALLIEQRRYDDARKSIDELQTSEDSKDAATQLLARWYAAQGKFTEAEKVYDEYIAAQPPEKINAGVYLSASRLFTLVGQPDRAVAFLEKGGAVEKPDTMLISREVGDVLFGAGKFAESATAYKRVLASGNPDTGDAVAKRILECSLNTRDWAQFDEIMAGLGPKVEQDATLLLLAAEAALQQDDAARATRLYDQAVLADPKNAMVYVKRAEFSRRDASRLQDAEADYEQAARLAPNSTIPLVRLALLHKSTGKLSQATDALQRALAIDPNDDGLRAELINMRLEQNQEAEAVALMEDAIKLKPESLSWLIQVARFMAQLNRHDTAAEYLARAWAARKDLDIAIPYVQALITKTPADPAGAWRIASDKALDAADEMNVRALKAMVLQRSGKASEAEAELTRAFAKVEHANPQQVQMFFQWLDLIFPGNDRAQLAALEKLGKKTPLSSWMYVQDGTIKLREPASGMQTAPAMEAYADAADDVSLKLSVYRVLGLYHYQTKAFPQCASLYRKFLALSPDDAEVLNNLAYVLATELKQPADALPFGERAVEKAPRSAGVLDTLGMVHLGLKNTDKAIQFLQDAVKRSADYREATPILLHLIEAQIAAGQRQEAQKSSEQVQTILDADPNMKRQHEPALKELRKQIDGR